MIGSTDRDKDIERKRAQRSEAARIVIPEVVDWNRRERALADPELFLKTYFEDRYKLRFGRHHLKMIDTIVSRAKYGGRQAVAAPRGCGKSELVKGLLVFLVLSGLVRFPLPGGATAKLGKRIYTDFRNKFTYNQILYEDFPEVCHPARALDGAPQRAGKQHVEGKRTGIIWTASEDLRLPDVPGSAYGGTRMAYFGLDTAFRGYNIDGDRPDFVLIDDPETRESAKSYDQGVDREEIIDKDIAGLASQEENLAIVVLTTVQNCYCLSYRITDRKIRPAFNGLRYGMIQSWPDAKDKWLEYVAIRHKDQAGGDEFGLSAVQFYLNNREEMDAGVEMLSDHYVETTLEDGTALVHSAIQQAYNEIAETNMDAYMAEYQNSPPEGDKEETLDLTAAIVANRTSELSQNELPTSDCKILLGLDIGDYYGHWVKVAMFGNAVGCVIDYGVMEVPGMVKGMEGKAKEIAIYRALLEFHPKIMEVNPFDFGLIDSGDGDHKDAVYGFVRDIGGSPWAASKGWDEKRFRMPNITMATQATKRAFKECWASHQQSEGLWLYNVNTEYWKHWLQQRFLTPTFDADGVKRGERIFNDGALSLYAAKDIKRHMSFAHHVVAEERQMQFEEGKGWKRKWAVLSRNNHYLDALALACAAGGCLGIELIQRDEFRPQPVKEPEPRQQMTNQYGQPFLITER